MKWYWVSLGYSKGGAVCIANNERIVETSPVFAWMKEKTLDEVRAWLLESRASVKELKSCSF
jgi:hypothetical protein